MCSSQAPIWENKLVLHLVSVRPDMLRVELQQKLIVLLHM